MTEEQFWRSNPRIIKVYEEAYRKRIETENMLLHKYVGNYFLSAVVVGVDTVMNGKKAKAKYIDKPIEIFEKPPEDIAVIRKKQQDSFVAWANAMERNIKMKFGIKAEVTDG